MKKKIYLAILIFAVISTAFPQTYPHGQNIVSAEYFFNTDPGEGRGIPIPGTYNSADAVVDMNLDVPEGTKIYIRFKSSNGKWSAPVCIVYRNPVYYGRNSTITDAEFFINYDPGQGKATTAPAGDNIAFDLLNINRNNVLYLRVKDSYGRWSAPASSKFSYKSVISAQFYLLFKDKTTSQIYTMNIQPHQENSAFYEASGDISQSQINNLDSIFVRFQSETGLWGPWRGEKLVKRFLSVSTTSINFGILVNKINDTTITISNPSTSSENVNVSVSLTGSPYFSILDGGGSFTLSPGRSKNITIRFQPLSLDSVSAKLVINHNAVNYVNPLEIYLTGFR